MTRRLDYINKKIAESRAANFMGLREVSMVDDYGPSNRNYTLSFDDGRVEKLPLRVLGAFDAGLDFLDAADLSAKVNRVVSRCQGYEDVFAFDLQAFPFPRIYPGGENGSAYKFPGTLRFVPRSYQNPVIDFTYERGIPGNSNFLLSKQGVGLVSYLRAEKLVAEDAQFISTSFSLNPSRTPNGEQLSIGVRGVFHIEDASLVGRRFGLINKSIRRFCEDFCYPKKGAKCYD